MVCVLLYFFDEALDLGGLGKVGRNGNSFPLETTRGGELVEGDAGFFAGGGFARGDKDLGAAGLEEAIDDCQLSTLPTVGSA